MWDYYYYVCALMKHIIGSRLDVLFKLHKSRPAEVKKMCLKLVCVQEEEEGWSQVVAHVDSLQHDHWICLWRHHVRIKPKYVYLRFKYGVI